jgi:hypothetical protein
MKVNYSPKLYISLPWGEGSLSIPHGPYPRLSLSGRFITDSPRMIRPLFGVRIDKKHNLYVLFEIPQGASATDKKYRALCFNENGDFTHQLEFTANTPGDTWQIVDFAADHQGGLYVLDFFETPQRELRHQLRRINAQGREVWHRVGQADQQRVDFQNFAGWFEYLLVPDENTLLLPTRNPQEGLASFDVNTGEVLTIYRWEEPAGKLVAGSAHEVYYGRYLEDTSGRRQVVIKRDLSTHDREVIESQVQYLHDLAGVDADGNIYPRIHQGITRISPSGELEWQQLIYGLVVQQESQEIFICSRAEVVEKMMVFDVHQYSPSGAFMQMLTFRLSEGELPKGQNSPHLIGVDTASQFYFYAGETEHQGGTLFVFNQAGELIRTLPLHETDSNGQPIFDKVNQALLPIEVQTGPPHLIEVDPSANIYLPLSDPQGFKVIRLQPDQ